MAESSKSAVTVSQLNGSNYGTWKIQCKMALVKDGLWGVVDNTDPAPSVSDSEDKKAKYKSKKDKALATIVLSIEPALLYIIDEPNDPVVVWQKLADQFQKKTWANKLVLRCKLQSLKLKDGGSVQQHIREMTETFNELSVMGVAMDDEDRVVQLLASLPESYSTIVTALEANEKVPSLEVVTERLLHEERKLSERSSSSSNGAFSMKHKRSVRCHHCHKLGHFQRNCPERAHGGDKQRSYEPRHEHKSVPKAKGPDKRAGRHAAHSTRASTRYSSDSESDMVGLIVSQLALSVGSTNPDCWIIDSGATCHISNNRSLFVEYESLDESQSVTLGDGHTLEAVGKGVVALKLELEGGKTITGRLHDVLYVPELAYNLLSISKVTKLGKRVDFYKSHCNIIDDNERIIATGTKRGDLYYLCCRQIHQAHMSDARLTVSKEYIWHQRFGHLSESGLHMLSNQKLVDDFDYNTAKSIPLCKPCIDGKLHRSPFPKKGRTRPQNPLELVHSDICGPMKTPSLSGAKYFLTFVDDKTHYIWIYVLKHKSEPFSKFLEWKAQVELESSLKLKVLRTDNGGEYTSTEFNEYLKREGIKHELSVPKNPEQNGVAERFNRTLIEAVRAMLSSSSLPHKFWAEALSTAVYLKNRSYTKAVINMTPHEAWNGRRPSVKHLRVFGCTAYSHIPKDERSKLDPKARLLGYSNTTKGYRLYDTKRDQVFYSRDVIFDEMKLGFEKEQDGSITENNNHFGIDLSSNQIDDVKDAVPDQIDVPDQNDVPDQPDDRETNTETEAESETVRRSHRDRRRPDYYGTWIYTADAQKREPRSVTEAMSSNESEKWSEAMEREMKSIESNNVWELVELPEGKKPIGCKWVYKVKTGADGEVERYKARLVAKGFSQQYGLDYDQTFSPVARFKSLRLLLALAVQNGLTVHQMDVTTAFLNGTLKEEVYMDQPEGYVEKGKEKLVCRLNHSLYGLKQAPRCWNSVLDQKLKENGFVQTASDPCIYKAVSGDDFIIGIYVDDILLAGKSKERMIEVKSVLSNMFEVKDLGELNYFLGVKVVQNHKDGTIWIGQPTFTESLLNKFQMHQCKSLTTPTDTGTKLVNGTEDSEYVDKSEYQSLVGSLLYLSMRTRPDITYAVSVTARFCSNPTTQHMTAVKRILRYLRGTTHHGLLYKRSRSKELLGYSDADWGGDRNDCKSTSGYLFQLGGTAITWQSKKQTCVALSTAEAEYIALAGAAQEAV